MPNLFQELNATFTFRMTATGSNWVISMDTPTNKQPSKIMTASSKLAAQCSAEWLTRAAAGAFDDETILNELVRVPKHYFPNAGEALLKVLAHRTNLSYNDATHTLSKAAIPTAYATHLLFGNSFIKVKLTGMTPEWGIENDGILMFVPMTELEANQLTVWLNRIANDPSAKNLDIAEWLVRNVAEPQLNVQGANQIRDLCDAAGATYNLTKHAITKPGGTPPPQATVKMGDWLDEREAEQDTFGIGKPGTKSTKEWTPDEPDPSVDLLKSIRDVCDGSRL